MNKNLLKELAAEAMCQIKQSGDEDADSDEGCSSSEEEVELPASSANAKKAMQEIIEEEISPDKKDQIEETLDKSIIDTLYPQPNK